MWLGDHCGKGSRIFPRMQSFKASLASHSGVNIVSCRTRNIAIHPNGASGMEKFQAWGVSFHKDLILYSFGMLGQNAWCSSAITLCLYGWKELFWQYPLYCCRISKRSEISQVIDSLTVAAGLEGFRSSARSSLHQLTGAKGAGPISHHLLLLIGISSDLLQLDLRENKRLGGP